MSSHKLLLTKHIRTPLTLCVRNMGKGEPGSGSGDGGGAGGAIRDAGGAFGKRQAAQEDQYFRKLQEEQLKKLKEKIDGGKETTQPKL
ncbi:ATPase inhibitor mai-2, mitochondrial-like isoform X2 [Palaemon carinicauda]|uniref:ATPase inhibitor mai-2, mitochondrial-like isoform X2 n=1 Tax=Palaemon carinicauda TaxID=392227 RepID=UPI0035B695CA